MTQKNTHISGHKIVHKCTIIICINAYYYFINFPIWLHFFSLFFLWNELRLFSSPSYSCSSVTDQHWTRKYHPNTKTPKLNLTITYYKTKKNLDEIKAKINQNSDDHHHPTTTTISTQHHPTITSLPPQPISTFDNPNTKSNLK